MHISWIETQGGATGLNDHGQVTGFYLDANGLQHGYLLSGGQYTTLDDPAGVLGNAADSINNSGKVVGAYIDANGVFHGYLATPAHGDSAISSPGAAGGRSSTAPLMNAFGSFELAIPDPLPPGSTPVAPSKPDRLPTLPAVSRVDQVFAEDRWSMEHRSFMPSNPKSEGLPLDWLHNGPADDFGGNW